jgi:hypothetical protein
MQVNINHVSRVRREYPNWALRAKIKKVDEAGNIVEGQYGFGGEVVRVSPRYQKHGTNYRVRPERPAAFFAAFLQEGGVLPTLLTSEECGQEWVLELLDPLWEQYKAYFPKLESPYAACDSTVVPSHRVGFSFNILQVLVEPIGTAHGSNGKQSFRPLANGSTNASVLDTIRKRIEEMRARNATKPEVTAPGKKKG